MQRTQKRHGGMESKAYIKHKDDSLDLGWIGWFNGRRGGLVETIKTILLFLQLPAFFLVGMELQIQETQIHHLEAQMAVLEKLMDLPISELGEIKTSGK